MSMKYPYQNPDAEEASGLTKKMQERMKFIERDWIHVSNIAKFIIGDILDVENGNISQVSKPKINSQVCW